MKILWTQTAYRRLEEIFAYIEIDSPQNAQKWLGKLLVKVEPLKGTPKLGRKVPELNSPVIRELIHDNYRIIYRLSGESLFLLTVRHFKQILPMEDFLGE